MNDKARCHPSDVINNMKIHHEVKVSYDKAWRGREIASNSIRGTLEASYALLSAFSDAMIRNNLGTYTTEEADEEGRLKSYLMALAALIDAWNYHLPVILVDDATMKNKYLSTLISTCTINGDNQIVPLAFVVVDSKNDLSRTWLFRNFKIVFGENNELNLKKNHKSLLIDDSFHKCARAYTPLEFEYYMRQLDHLSPSIRCELEGVGRHRWARAFFRRKRYSVITTNISESMNSTLKEARELPVIGLLESIRSLVKKWFYEHRIK
ncbi:uncharacterized protein LOC127148929 [Cucumis melo]|uniref:Uncharacterized protein LOC127148929 n=1 Tax=Cucumis melo TaxID=3656 RepID=A0ABM3KNH4_CUCME|nr:uncharacterized protein LOC127148929 [Cucumis melo]